MSKVAFNPAIVGVSRHLQHFVVREGTLNANTIFPDSIDVGINHFYPKFENYSWNKLTTIFRHAFTIGIIV